MVIEHDMCIASGACVRACPEVFDQDDEGMVVVLQEHPGPELRDRVLDAAKACPALVISVEDE